MVTRSLILALLFCSCLPDIPDIPEPKRVICNCGGPVLERHFYAAHVRHEYRHRRRHIPDEYWIAVQDTCSSDTCWYEIGKQRFDTTDVGEMHKVSMVKNDGWDPVNQWRLDI